jgi:transaldolase
MKEYEQHLKDAIHYGKTQWHNYSQAHLGYAKDADASKFNYEALSDEEKRLWRLFVFEKLTVSFGIEIIKIIPGWVSTQLDPRLAYDKELMLQSARRMARHYEIAGVSKERYMIKVPSTWEGICVAKE